MVRFWIFSLVLLVPSLGSFTVADDNANQPAGKTYALLVAGADYDPKELQPLKYTQQDILAVYDALLEVGVDENQIVLMHDKQSKNYLPECRKIRKQLDLLLSRLEPADTLVVALAGHGIQFAGEKLNYFCPVDAQLQDKTTLVSLEEIYAEMQKCRASRKLLLVDACRNDPQATLARSRAEVKLESITRPQDDSIPQGIVALFSCSPGQQSYEHPDLQHGIFFYHILEAWRGAGDANKDGLLTLDEMISYAKEKTQTFAHLKLQAKQLPYQRNDFQGTWVVRSYESDKKQDEEPQAYDVKQTNRRVEVERNGTWWPAVILKREPDRYQVHFSGWDSRYDEWVPAKRIRYGYYRNEHEPELAVEWKNKWWPAVILELKTGGNFKVHYIGFNDSWDEWVTTDRMFLNLPRRDERRVKVFSGNAWYPASILNQRQNQYFVHYIGWKSSWDEWVTADRIRSP